MADNSAPTTEEITLESLLDAPAATHANDSKTVKRPSYVLHTQPLAKQARGQPFSRAKEAALELVAILLQQDVNGFFHFVPKHAIENPLEVPMHLRGLERFIHTCRITSLGDLRGRVESLFAFYRKGTQSLYTSPNVVAHEALRLNDIASRWFASLPAGALVEPIVTPLAVASPTLVTSSEQIEKESEDTSVALGLLNPDNHGILNSTERVRTIGEEVGALTSGTHLSQYGGYREDRRNRVIPYTYLNYGPYSTFGPAFDSGASNCSPEANQLLLSTSWLPARMLYSLDKTDTSTNETCPWSCVHVAEGLEHDIELVAALADCTADWKAGQEETEILDSIIPPVVCGDHPEGDFGLYLANAITRNLPMDLSEEEENNAVDEKDSEKIKSPRPEATNKKEEKEAVGVPANEQEEGVENTTDENGRLLTRSADLLRGLYSAQYRRLGSDFSCAGDETSLRPSVRELRTAHQLADSLVNLVGRISKGPGDLITSRASLHRALALPPDLIDHSPLPTPAQASATVDLADEVVVE